MRLQILLAALAWLTIGPGALVAEVAEISWDYLLPKEKQGFDDPFEKLSEEQLLDLGMIARIRFLLAGEKIAVDGPDSKEEKKLVAKLTEQGIDVDWILTQRERVAEQRQRQAEKVDDSIDGKRIRIPGYMLPLKHEEAKGVTEFLLVPWVGACIHTPPPPPNQMIHVAVPEGTENKGRFAPIWLEGRLELKPGSYDLYLVDGTRSVNVAFTFELEAISDYSSRDSDVLSKVEAPVSNPEHSWWQNLQTRVSILFTKTMTSIKDRESSGPLWFGLMIAFVYGVIHTLGPGHGKAVVVSYFVGHGGSVVRGLRMGTLIAVFHVLSAIIVVWVTDFAVRQATGNAPSDYRLVKLVSYAAIALIGLVMLWKAIRSARIKHTHEHEGDEANHHHHHEGCHACEAISEKKGPAGWLALAVGSVPCTGALLVLLFGMANNLLMPAILMVVAISLGMAIAMSAIGMLAILGRNYVDRKLEADEARHHRFANGARIAGAAVVVMIGAGLFGLTLAFDPRMPVPVPETASGQVEVEADTATPGSGA